MKKRYSVLPLAAAVGLVLGIAPAAYAAKQQPPQPTCATGIVQAVGQSSITLTHDLSCPNLTGTTKPPHDLTPFTVNLNGHRISAIRDWGISDVTYENGTLTSVSEITGEYETFKNITFDGGGIGFGGNPVILNSRFINGASITGSQSNVDVENTTFVNGPTTKTNLSGNVYPLHAIDGFQTGLIAHNVTITGYAEGIAIYDNTSSVDIEHSRITGVHGDGIVIGDKYSGVSGMILDNVVSNNAGNGIALLDGSGGLARFSPYPMPVTGNTTNNNGGDGIRIANDGLGIGGIDVSLTANTANSNGHFGIETMITSNDTVENGGGNVAKKNSAGQCLNIVCGK
jgi:hypothetical protein